MSTDRPPAIAHFIRVFAVPILLGWVALVVLLNVAVPSLEEVGQAHSVSLSPGDAPSMRAMKHIGRVFKESDSDASAMVVLEGDQPLGDEAHRYYAELIRKFRADTKHITHVQDFWGDPLTAAGAQSTDGKATYVQVYLTGNMGEPLANESIAALRQIVDSVPVPSGLHVYVTGTTALFADQHKVGDKSLKVVTAITVAVILISLFIVYRSVGHGGAGAGDGDAGSGGRPWGGGSPGPLRPDRLVDVLGEPPDHVGHRGGHRLRDLRVGPLSRGPQRRTRIAPPPSTRCTGAPRTSCWVRA